MYRSCPWQSSHLRGKLLFTHPPLYLVLRLLLAFQKCEYSLKEPHVLFDEMHNNRAAQPLAIVPPFAALALLPRIFYRPYGP
jgi:hypothetical protein